MVYYNHIWIYIYIYLGKLKRPHCSPKAWKWWFIFWGIIPIAGRTVQVSELLYFAQIQCLIFRSHYGNYGTLLVTVRQCIVNTVMRLPSSQYAAPIFETLVECRFVSIGGMESISLIMPLRRVVLDHLRSVPYTGTMFITVASWLADDNEPENSKWISTIQWSLVVRVPL